MPAEFFFERTWATVTGQYIQLAFFGLQQFFIPARGHPLDTDDNSMPMHVHVCPSMGKKDEYVRAPTYVC